MKQSVHCDGGYSYSHSMFTINIKEEVCLVSNIIVEIVESPDPKHGCWGIKVSHESGELFFDTGMFMKEKVLHIGHFVNY